MAVLLIIAEAWPLLSAIKHTQRLGVSRACFESDNCIVVNCVLDKQAGVPWEISLIVWAIRERFSSKPQFTVPNVLRQCNRFADWVAGHVLKDT
ncbi:hypothetical protein SLE2022_075770 [Rubroshorea leprosula]